MFPSHHNTSDLSFSDDNPAWHPIGSKTRMCVLPGLSVLNTGLATGASARGSWRNLVSAAGGATTTEGSANILFFGICSTFCGSLFGTRPPVSSGYIPSLGTNGLFRSFISVYPKN